MPEQAQETHLDPERGLWIPPEFREFGQGIVIRTPRGTMQHFGDGPMSPYYGMVDERSFGAVSEFCDPRNPDLAPDKVRVKPYGEEAVELTVALPNGGELR